MKFTRNPELYAIKNIAVRYSIGSAKTLPNITEHYCYL